MTDSLTMLHRQLRHVRRYPEVTVIVLVIPIVFLLLFVYVFGGTLGAGLGSSGDRADYADYVVPGILAMTVASIAAGTSTSVAMDLSSGIIARFRTMSISPGAVLTGHAFSAVLQTLGSLVVVLAVAFGVGFRPSASALDWLGALALLTGLALAVSWLSVALGLVARSVESASNYPMILTLLPFLGSGFVPSDSMPGPLAWFAQYQPFTPIMDTLRRLLLEGPVDAGTAWAAAAWCGAITLLGYLLARRTYARPRNA